MNAIAFPQASRSPGAPAMQVIASINVPEDVAAVRSEFARAGFAAGDVVVFAGREALRRLSELGFVFSPMRRLLSLLRGNDKEMGLRSIARQAEELQAGHALVGVAIHGEEEMRGAEAILMRCHGHYICHCPPSTLPDTDSATA